MIGLYTLGRCLCRVVDNRIQFRDAEPACDSVHSFEAPDFSDREDTTGIANLRHDENNDSGKAAF